MRDRALLLLGYAGTLRRSGPVAVEREHVSFTSEGLRLQMPRGKAATGGQGAEVGIPCGSRSATCLVRALESQRLPLRARIP